MTVVIKFRRRGTDTVSTVEGGAVTGTRWDTVGGGPIITVSGMYRTDAGTLAHAFKLCMTPREARRLATELLDMDAVKEEGRKLIP